MTITIFSYGISVTCSNCFRRCYINSLELEAVASCSVKKLFLEISQNSQENTCLAVSFLIKVCYYEFCEFFSNTLIFCEHFCTSCCISVTILPEIVSFLKIVGKIRSLVRKRLQKSNSDVIFHYISLPIYPLHFLKFCPIQKQQKMLKSFHCLVKATLIFV